MKETAVIAIRSHPRYLCLVRAVTARLGELSGLDEAATEQVKLAVDEACSNVIKYAYRGDTGRKIVVKFRLKKNALEVAIEDNGLKADPGSIKGRSLDDVRPGGLGIHFIRRVFDVFQFDEKKKNGNRLRLIKYIEEKHEDRYSRP